LTHTRSTASNFEQVANLLCAQANSASYPQQDGKQYLTYCGLRGEGLVWLIGAMVCLQALWAQAMDGHIMRCGTISSCQSAATSEIVKRCWSRV